MGTRDCYTDDPASAHIYTWEFAKEVAYERARLRRCRQKLTAHPVKPGWIVHDVQEVA